MRRRQCDAHSEHAGLLQAAADTNRVVWDAVHEERMSLYWRSALFEIGRARQGGCHAAVVRTLRAFPHDADVSHPHAGAAFLKVRHASRRRLSPGESFPGLRHANAGRFAWSPSHCPVGAGGERIVPGGRWSVRVGVEGDVAAITKRVCVE